MLFNDLRKRVKMFFRTFRAHLVSSEYNHHVYTKALTLSYSFHELVDEASLAGIAAILPELRLLIQQYFYIVDYVGSLYGQ